MLAKKASDFLSFYHTPIPTSYFLYFISYILFILFTLFLFSIFNIKMISMLLVWAYIYQLNS